MLSDEEACFQRVLTSDGGGAVQGWGWTVAFVSSVGSGGCQASVCERMCPAWTKRSLLKESTSSLL